MSTDSFPVSVACSAGMTCMPIPAPPGGAMAVMRSSGRNIMRSKNAVTCGCSSICCLFMLKNPALPGTNTGSTYCFSRRGFSRLYPSKPPRTPDRAAAAARRRSCRWPSAALQGSWACAPSCRAPLQPSLPARPQYSGSSAARGRRLAGMRSVIICPSFIIFSRGGSSRGI